MNAETFRALALALPEAQEAPHHDRAGFRVGKKLFATLVPGGEAALIGVQPRERLDALMADYPGVFFTEGRWKVPTGAVGVMLAAVDPDLMRELLADSWAQVAPKRAIAAFRSRLE